MKKTQPRKQRVMIYVQHLLGIGHLVRTSRIAKAISEGLFEVVVVSGGLAVSGFELGETKWVQLAPVKAGSTGFSALIHPDGSTFTEADKAARSKHLIEIFSSFQPDVLLIEAFPFGRRQMRFELLPLLEAAKARMEPILIATSVRDILQENRKPGRDQETVDLVEQYFDLVLVHGESEMITLEDTFPLSASFRSKIAYTGMVGAGRQQTDLHPLPAQDRFEVIVSAGGGAVGEGLLMAAIAARPFSTLAEARWLIVSGPNLSDEAARRLESLAAPGLIIRRFMPDLPTLLKTAQLSISQAGYNTAADILAAGCASVLVPFAADGETEQTRRAILLEQRGLAISLAEDHLSARALAAAMERALALPKSANSPSLDGAEETRRILERWLSINDSQSA